MRRLAIVSIVLLILVAGLDAANASGRTEFDTSEECIGSLSADDMFEGTGCRTVNGGKWVVDGGAPRAVSDPSSMFGTFVFLAILWSLVPFGIAVAMASSRGESIGGAVLLTLVLGWIGLAIVYFGQANSKQAVQGLASRASSPPPPPAPSPGPPASAASAEDRLKRLERLRSEALITETEYEEQRRRIVETL